MEDSLEAVQCILIGDHLQETGSKNHVKDRITQLISMQAQTREKLPQ